MNRSASSSLRFEGSLTLIFALLGILLTGLVTVHWWRVVEPLLWQDAASRSLALAQSEGRNLERVFNTDSELGDLRAALEDTLAAGLLVKEPVTDTPFIRHIALMLDYDVLPVTPGSLDLVAGVADCPDCFASEVPLYHPVNRQLIGVATFQSDPVFLLRLIRSVRLRLLWLGLVSLSLIALAALGARLLLRRLHLVEEELRRSALTDPLTGIANRRALFERLRAELERVERYPDQRCSIILFDLDHFKAINDRHGHATGDLVLIDIARALLRVIRKTDLVGRYGGEEFLVILPHTDRAAARDVATRIRDAVAALTWPAALSLTVTISGGISESDGTDADALIDAADRALYRAKDGGRDRIEG